MFAIAIILSVFSQFSSVLSVYCPSGQHANGQYCAYNYYSASPSPYYVPVNSYFETPAANAPSTQNIGTYFQTSSNAACGVTCSQYPRGQNSPVCLGYVTNQCGSQINCWLKSQALTFVTADSSTNGFALVINNPRNYKVKNGQDTDGMNLFYFSGPTNACRQACDMYPGCLGYVEYSAAGQGCNLKGVIGQVSINWKVNSVHLTN